MGNEPRSTGRMSSHCYRRTVRMVTRGSLMIVEETLETMAAVQADTPSEVLETNPAVVWAKLIVPAESTSPEQHCSLGPSFPAQEGLK